MYQFFVSSTAPPPGRLVTTRTTWNFMGERRMTFKDAKRTADSLLDGHPRVRVFRAKGLGVGNMVLDLTSRRCSI